MRRRMSAVNGTAAWRKDTYLTRGDPLFARRGRSASGDAIKRSRKSAEVIVPDRGEGPNGNEGTRRGTLDPRYAEDSHPSEKNPEGSGQGKKG